MQCNAAQRSTSGVNEPLGKQGNRRFRLRTRSSAAPGGSVTVYDTVINSCPIESLLRRLFLAVMYKYDVIRKTGST